MKTVTIHIPKRADKKTPWKARWYEWDGESLKGVRFKEVSLDEGRLTKTAKLKKLKGLLDSNIGVEEIQQQGLELANEITGGRLAPITDGCRIYLNVEDPALEGVPWEILQGALTFALDPKCSLVRTSTQALTAAPPPDSRPLKVLLLLSLPDGDGVGGRKEASVLKRLFWKFDHRFDCVVVDSVTEGLVDTNSIRALLAREKPDTLHFIGHASPSGLEIRYGPKGAQKWLLKADGIQNILRGLDSYAPRLVFLNACRTDTNQTAGASTGARVDLGSVATAFVKQGTLSAISMQGEVSGEIARRAAAAFYQTLGEGKSLERAVTELRASIPAGSKESYFPVFTVAHLADTILPERPKLDDAVSRCLDDRTGLAQLEDFVDRHEDRRILVRNFLDTGAEDKHRYSAALILGDSLTGKSCFCYWWMRMCLWQNMPAYYVVPRRTQDLKNTNWLETVHQICEGDNSLGVVSRPLPKEEVRRFYWELEQIIEGKEAPFDPPAKNFKPQRRTLLEITTSRGASNDIAVRVLGAFHDALKRIAGKGKLTLIFDDWISKSETGTTDAETLITNLLEPIAADREGPLRVMVVASSSKIKNSGNRLGLEPSATFEFSPSWHRVKIEEFDLRTIMQLALEYVERYIPDADSCEIEQKTRRPLGGQPDLKKPKDAISDIVSILKYAFSIARKSAERAGK